MDRQSWKPPRVVLLASGLLVISACVAFGADLLRRRADTEAPATVQLEKRQLALWGDLELERAVQALKDSILRGDSAYGEDFQRHMEEVERAATLYAGLSTLDRKELDALRHLHAALPQYRSAIYTVGQMRERNARIQDIDRAVRGEDRPVSAAWDQLADVASESGPADAQQDAKLAGIALGLALGGALVAYALLQRARPSVAERTEDLRDLSQRLVRWEDAKEAKASEHLYEGVCQSLSAVMYMLRGCQNPRLESSGFNSRHNLEAILQTALREARAIAVQLRQPRLQEAGLNGSLDSIWFDCQARSARLHVDALSQVDDRDVSEELQSVLLRVAQMCADWSGSEASAEHVHWRLGRSGGRVHLLIAMDFAEALDSAPGRPDSPSDPGFENAIHARVILSGGDSEGFRTTPHGRALAASWPILRFAPAAS